MDGAADSDHSMTWEDFFGSTTDLTPTLIGIYDSLLEPSKPHQATSKPQANKLSESSTQAYQPEPSRLHGDAKALIIQANIDKRLTKAKDARTDPPNEKIESTNTSKQSAKIAGGIKLPALANVNKSSLYSRRTNVTVDESVSVNNGATVSVNKCNLSVSDSSFLLKSGVQSTAMKDQRVKMLESVGPPHTSFDNLSPNVKRMISSASDTTASNPLKLQNKKPFSARASVRGHKSNIPLVGATSKISQSGVDILDSVEIYDQPTLMKSVGRNQSSEDEKLQELPVKTIHLPFRPELRIEAESPTTYDVPTNLQAIYDVPSANAKTAFESLSLPYIDQSIELSISNDREFDIKLNSKDNSPEQPKTSTPESSPFKSKTPLNGTNSLNRKDVLQKTEVSSKQLQKSGPYPDAIGSTGNLKLCTVPEKEAGRLNPPTVEVSRPLSMSSIASSSSTSSSGVQNKGGVNSAYLASIESLDDHSDADMVSANGSNNFVNSTGMLNAGNSESLHSKLNRDDGCGERAGLTQLQCVCSEIVETENVYVEDLRQVVEGYLHVWRESNSFSSEELSELFNNIEDIYAFNRSLCERLNTCQLDPTSLARQFVDNTGGFSVYTSYCTGYPQTMSRLAALASCPVGTRACRERQAALQHALPLGSYLLKPVQRILKYHLLLQNLVKQCRCRETEYALLKMTGIAQHIDDMKRRHEHAVRVQEIQSLLYGWSGPDLTTYGELCAEGTFRVFGAKAMRHAFLFDKMLLLTKNREDGILAYKSHILCNNLMLVESIAGAPLSFHVIPWDAPRAQLTLQARSQRHKREWTLLLKRVILENYNAVIPTHARQLVMELGQNKTDDDILAEKSHNLITHASMRKQLSAPEYLEKRKLERERRKTFDNSRIKKSNRKTVASNSANSQDQCDCAQVSLEKGTDYTCESCYVDLCSDCEAELSKDKTEPLCSCKNDLNAEKCPECDRSLHYIDSGSAEHLERKQSCCKCSDFKSSQESFGKDYSGTLNGTRGYHSSDNIVSYTENSKEDLSDLNNVKNMQKTCLKCAKIKENIAITDTRSEMMHRRKSRCNELEKLRTDTLRSKSKDDPQRSKLSKISTWRRKSEPGLENGSNVASIVSKKVNDRNDERPVDVPKGYEKIEFECRNCGSTKMSRKNRGAKNDREAAIDSDQGMSIKAKNGVEVKSNSLEVRMYNTKHVPKKISKLKKSRAKGMRLGSDVTAKFYADFSTDVSTENILHISESTDSINTIPKEEKGNPQSKEDTAKHDSDIDEETYRKLIEKTDSFKKNELEKVKYLNQQKVINEGAECESDKQNEPEKRHKEDESGEESEKPLEQIISQLLMQNREFQKILKKQQLRNGAQRRHQRLLKSHSNPEQVIAARNREQHKIRPKYGRQTSENFKFTSNETEEIPRLSPQKEVDDCSEDDHIYETLRVAPELQTNVNPNKNPPPKPKSPSPLITCKKLNMGVNSRLGTFDSDYVYLSFDKMKHFQPIEDDGIYDVPSSIPVEKTKLENPAPTDYYVAITNQSNDNIYDHITNTPKRDRDNANTTGEYLPMSKDQHNPNTTEIWLSRQKEHFNVSRDRKSGSLPRSFQVLASPQDDNSLTTFKSKSNGSNKTYLNKDGKVLSIDRPFTIASDKSEISYDDVETYMNDDDVLKYNKTVSNQNSFYDSECLENLSRSTLELEEEIDRCYKNNFEKNMEADKNRNLLTDSQQNINVSITSSCEVLSPEKQVLDNISNVILVLPEHKIYKPTTNLLSLKNVLSRFKTKTPSKNTTDSEQEINANEQGATESPKIDLKSPTSNEKRSALNPRSYSKNLLQRFKSIIGDEHPDGIQTKNIPQISSPYTEEINQNKLVTSEIKVVITSTDASPTTSTIKMSPNIDLLSKSVCEQTTLTESQNEKNNLDTLSHSCNDIKQPETQCFRPIYDKSISMITSKPSSVNSSPSRSNNSSYQNLNKLPIYKQGSKYLGARIAQSDYVDPQTLLLNDSKTDVDNVNVLINKNALRPDSLLSNSSFVTSSSEGTYQIEQQSRNTVENLVEENKSESVEDRKGEKISSDSSVLLQSDESFYEKSFEKIESIVDEDLFRDSAVYSDQEDSDDMKIYVAKNVKMPPRNLSRLETIKRNTSFKSEYVTSSAGIKKTEMKSNIQAVSTVTSTKKDLNQTIIEKTTSEPDKNMSKSKFAPPVPTKPKLTAPSLNKLSMHSKNFTKTTAAQASTTQKEITSSIESLNSKTVKRNSNIAKAIVRSDSVISSESVSITESTKTESLSRPESMISDSLSRSESLKSSKTIVKVASVRSVDENTESSSLKRGLDLSRVNKSKMASHSIQMKRLSFERTSLDSAIRRSKTIPSEANKRSSAELPKLVSKSVLERRLEIESLSKDASKTQQKQPAKHTQLVKPKPICSKMASYERSVSDDTGASRSESRKKDLRSTNSIEKLCIPKPGPSIATWKQSRSLQSADNNDQDENAGQEIRESWVKTIVNKFQ